MESDPVISLKSLSWSLLLLLVACLFSAFAVLGVQQLTQRASQANQQAQAQQAETRARLARAHDDEREIRAKIARYQEIIDQGRTQPERRLEWVETLRNIKTARRLLALEYEIAPQRPLDARQPAAGGYNFLVSPMKLEIPMLHENDLLGLLDDLRTQVQALVSVRSCKIERIAADPNRQNAANLKATCEIDWITLQEKT